MIRSDGARADQRTTTIPRRRERRCDAVAHAARRASVLEPPAAAATRLESPGGHASTTGLGYALTWAVAMRVVLSALAAWVLALHPPRESAVIRVQYLGQTALHDGVLAPWQRFDALWYTRIALHGYSATDGSTAYFPLYPLLVRVVSFPLGGAALAAALVVSTLAFGALLYVLYRFVAPRHGDGAARRTLLLLCLFPTASFLLGAYTESLFLLLAVGCLLAVDRERPLLAGLLALLAALTRVQGLMLALPLLWAALQGWRAGRRELRPWLAALCPAVGTGLFTLYVRVAVHDGPVTATLAGKWHMRFNPPWVTLGAYWSGLSAHGWQLFAHPTGNWVDLLNLLLALGMLALVLPARRLLGTGLWLYALATWVVTLTLHQSTARYMLTVFPALIVLAVWAPGRRAVRLALMIGAPLMLCVASQFVMWSFVG